MIVGNIIELLCFCLGNKPGTRGVVFHVFDDDVFQVIFPNGDFDGFNKDDEGKWYKTVPETTDLDYKFTHVMQVTQDFNNGLFKDHLEVANAV